MRFVCAKLGYILLNTKKGGERVMKNKIISYFCRNNNETTYNETIFVSNVRVDDTLCQRNGDT